MLKLWWSTLLVLEDTTQWLSQSQTLSLQCVTHVHMRITEFNKHTFCISCETCLILTRCYPVVQKCLETFQFSWHHPGMPVGKRVYILQNAAMSFLVMSQTQSFSIYIMKRSKRHLTSTLMDVWWLWLNAPLSNMGFRWAIHRLTFLLTSKRPQDALNLVRMTKAQLEGEYSPLFSLLHFLLLFLSWNKVCVDVLHTFEFWAASWSAGL